jgi:hypothetical protein
MLRAGDIVTLSSSPVIWLNQYRSLRPSATLTRTLQDSASVDSQMEEMEKDLHALLLRSLTVEIQLLDASYSVLPENGTAEGLLELCERELKNEKPSKSVKGSVGVQGKGGEKAPLKLGARKV